MEAARQILQRGRSIPKHGTGYYIPQRRQLKLKPHSHWTRRDTRPRDHIWPLLYITQRIRAPENQTNLISTRRVQCERSISLTSIWFDVLTHVDAPRCERGFMDGHDGSWQCRVGRGSKFPYRTQPDPQLKWPDLTRPKMNMKFWTRPILTNCCATFRYRIVSTWYQSNQWSNGIQNMFI